MFNSGLISTIRSWVQPHRLVLCTEADTTVEFSAFLLGYRHWGPCNEGLYRPCVPAMGSHLHTNKHPIPEHVRTHEIPLRWHSGVRVATEIWHSWDWKSVSMGSYTQIQSYNLKHAVDGNWQRLYLDRWYSSVRAVLWRQEDDQEWKWRRNSFNCFPMLREVGTRW